MPQAIRMVSAAAIAMSFALLAIVASARGWGVSRQEFQAGYTTLYARYYQYWQLDSKTGEVLRRPGEREIAGRRP